MSDIHSQLHKLTPLPADILIVAGDLTLQGTEAEFAKLNSDLRKIKHMYKRIFVMAGNHDFLAFNYPEKARKMITHGTYVEDEAVVIKNTKIYFSPWVPIFGAWAFMYPTEHAARDIWSHIPKDTDILVTHGPPAEVSPLDMADNSYAVGPRGCPILAEAVAKIKPKYHIFGHIHEGYGSIEKNGTNFMNVASLKRDYCRTNPAVVIEV
jgi:Icc-related predicted phosphoesterase